MRRKRKRGRNTHRFRGLESTEVEDSEQNGRGRLRGQRRGERVARCQLVLVEATAVLVEEADSHVRPEVLGGLGLGDHQVQNGDGNVSPNL